jgi:hypothetical protein
LVGVIDLVGVLVGNDVLFGVFVVVCVGVDVFVLLGVTVCVTVVEGVEAVMIFRFYNKYHGLQETQLPNVEPVQEIDILSTALSSTPLYSQHPVIPDNLTT